MGRPGRAVPPVVDGARRVHRPRPSRRVLAAEYRAHGAVQGKPLPAGLVEGSRLPTPVFTPSTKEPAGSGRHDAPLTFDEVVARVSEPLAEQLRRLTLDVYARGAELAAERGVVIADTKPSSATRPTAPSCSATSC